MTPKKLSTVTVATVPATTQAVALILDAPQGARQALREVTRAARKITGTASGGRPPKDIARFEEALQLVGAGATKADAAKIVANRIGGGTRDRENNRRCILRQLEETSP